jgi:hypothetical protein
MNVVGHQAPGVERNVPQFELLSEIVKVIEPVPLRAEDRLAIVASLDNVVRITRDERARASRHVGTSMSRDGVGAVGRWNLAKPCPEAMQGGGEKGSDLFFGVVSREVV